MYLCIRKGKTIFEKSSGYAHLSNKVSNKLDTRFATASAGKAFVAAAILQLIEKGSVQQQWRFYRLINQTRSL
jgi:CubicO group peptidase (beta-lactamase class C family)